MKITAVENADGTARITCFARIRIATITDGLETIGKGATSMKNGRHKNETTVDYMWVPRSWKDIMCEVVESA